jgi:LysM repeat protein
MKNLRQVLLGILAALLSSGIILGSFVLSLAEGGVRVAAAFTVTSTSLSSPSPTLPPITQKPGEPTYTPSPVPSNTPVPVIPTVAAKCTPLPGWVIYTTQVGDTLETLAQEYHTTPAELRQVNCMEFDTLYANTTLYVPNLPPTNTSTPTHTALPTDTPPPAKPTRTLAPTQCIPPRGWVLYTIKRGDTLFTLSKILGVTVSQLQQANCIISPDNIRAGQKIYVPFLPATNTPPPTAAPTRLPPTSTFTSPPPTATSQPTPTPTETPVIPISTKSPEPTVPAPPPTDTPPAPSATPVTVEPPPVPVVTPGASLQPGFSVAYEPGTLLAKLASGFREAIYTLPGILMFE